MSNKTSRDSENNAKFRDVYVHTDGMPWIADPFSKGIWFKVLRTSAETGAWTVLFKCEKGSAFARHQHLGAGEYFMLSGKTEVRGGVQNGGITACAGDYGYEPSGVIHDSTCFVEDSMFLFTNYGPLKFIDDDDNTLFVVDWLTVRAIEAQGLANLAPAAAAAE
jgi:quercetin dioxygenase-like cupin family protein